MSQSVQWLAILAIFIILAKTIGSGMRSGMAEGDQRHICPACGTAAQPTEQTRGSIWIELVLWLCLIVPGVIYSIWRMTTKTAVCPTCLQPGMIPVDSPRGRQLLAQYAAPKN